MVPVAAATTLLFSATTAGLCTELARKHLKGSGRVLLYMIKTKS